jgi:membrane fusion protein (multidrug efflux system)
MLSKKTLWISGAVVLAIVLFTVISTVARSCGKSGPSPGNAPSSRGLAVRGVVVQPEPFHDRVFTTGTVLANEWVSLRSEINERVVRILFREGARVSKGDLLVKLQDSELQAQLLKLTTSEKLAAEKEDRQKQMLANGAISQEEYDATLANLNLVRADIQLVRAQLAKTEIRAPFNGIVGLRDVSEGAIVSSGTEIATLQDISSVKIDFSVPEKYASIIKVGNAVRFQTAGNPRSMEAKVYAVEPRVDVATRSLQVRARCENPGGAVLPGSFAEVFVELGIKPRAMVLLSDAIVPGARGSKVYLFSRGIALSRDVEIGLRDSARVEITKGLAFGDTVITTGLLQIRPQMPVTVTLSEKP